MSLTRSTHARACTRCWVNYFRSQVHPHPKKHLQQPPPQRATSLVPNARDGFTGRTPGGSVSTHQAISDCFKSSASERRSVRISRLLGPVLSYESNAWLCLPTLRIEACT
jgi:hypothetical protein